MIDPNFYFNDEAMQYTSELCPNNCGKELITWNEAYGPDDYRQVWYCSSCNERFEE